MDKFINGIMIVLVVSIGIFALFLPKLALPTPVPNFAPNLNVNPDNRASDGPTQISSVQENDMYLSGGNAASAYDPNSEHITLTNGSTKDVNITGWQLTNGKASRTYPGGANGIHYASDTVVIPQGVRIFTPLGANYPQDIILKPGETAILITGSSFKPNSYALPSFEENSCTGYLNKDYRFPEGISLSCPYTDSEPNIAGLDRACRDYIDSLPSCREPNLSYRNDEGLSSSCRNFIESHYNYGGCVANHARDNQFPRTVWHVYLHHEWEMWAEKYETISLFDRAHNLVTQLNY